MINNKSFKVDLAKTVKRCLNDGNEDEAFQTVSETKDVLKWRDEGYWNCTLIHYATHSFKNGDNRNTFLEKIFKDKKVVIIY